MLIPDNFWSDWEDADELHQIKLVQSLIGLEQFNRAKLVNTYFASLKDYVNNRFNEDYSPALNE